VTTPPTGRTPQQVVLHSRQWVPLPGTDYEVMLHGKAGTLILTRGNPELLRVLNGWWIPVDRTYVRLTDTAIRRRAADYRKLARDCSISAQPALSPDRPDTGNGASDDWTTPLSVRVAR
jgi:hypothetical protein